MRKRIAFWLAMIAFCTNTALAADITTTEEIIIRETQIDTSIDNSSLPVRVTSSVDGVSTVIYQGSLGGYDNGSCRNMDFTTSQFAVIITWDSDEVIYIVPLSLYENSTTGDIDNDRSEPMQNQAPISIDGGVGVIQYDLEYSFIEGNMNINAVFSNSGTVSAAPILIAAIYDDSKLVDTIFDEVTLCSNTDNQEKTLTVEIPEERNDNYSIKLMVWDSLDNLIPLGNAKFVKDIDDYVREKHIFVTADSGSDFKLFMNLANTIGDNDIMTHTIRYDETKIEPIDLCGLTFEKETDTCIIPDAGVTVVKADLQNGEIEYNFSKPGGRNTGINNFIKFRALSDFTESEITYIIQ